MSDIKGWQRCRVCGSREVTTRVHLDQSRCSSWFAYCEECWQHERHQPVLEDVGIGNEEDTP